MSEVTFIEDGHLYLDEYGVIIPSVTQLVDFAFPGGYSDVPEYILQNKAKYGTKVHGLIESYEAGEVDMKEIHFSRIDPNIKSALNQYQKWKEKCPDVFDIVQMEQLVNYQGRYAGKFDLMNKDGFLIDIKTTAQLHKDWLALQLGLYYLAAHEMGYIKDLKRNGYCLWMPKKEPAQLILIDVYTPEQCLKVLKKYEKEHNSDEILL